jgi:hypothetical protein
MLNQRATTNEQTVAAATITNVGTDKNCVSWSIKIGAGTATSGTVAMTAKSPGASSGEVVYDEFGSAIVFNAATSTAQTYYFSNKPVDMVILTPTALDGTYTYSFSQN